MIRFRGTVSYTDDRESESFVVGPMAQAAWERYAIGKGIPTGAEDAPMLHLSFIAYWAVAVRGAKGAAPSFESWCAVVDDLTIEVESPDPTPPGAPEE